MCLAFWQSKAPVICLQVVDIEPNLEVCVQSEWGLDSTICPHRSNSRGVMILFNNKFEYKILGKKDAHGNFVVVKMEIAELMLTLANIYRSYKDNPNFKRQLNESLMVFLSECHLLWKLHIKIDK